MANRLDVANAALSALGATPITGTDDGSAEADAVNSLWDFCLNEVFTASQWKCLRTSVMPQPANEAELAERASGWRGEGWNKAYEIPPNFKSIFGITLSEGRKVAQNPYTKTDYDTFLARFLLVYDEEPVYLKLAMQLQPRYWPDYIEPPIIYKLAQNLAILLTDDTAKVTAFHGLYKESLEIATFIDSSGTPSRPMESNIDRVRQGGGEFGYTRTIGGTVERRLADGETENFDAQP